MPIEHEDSNFVSHEPCDMRLTGRQFPLVRRASLLRLRDHTPPEGETVDTETLPPPTNTPLLDGTARAIPRGLVGRLQEVRLPDRSEG